MTEELSVRTEKTNLGYERESEREIDCVSDRVTIIYSNFIHFNTYNNDNKNKNFTINMDINKMDKIIIIFISALILLILFTLSLTPCMAWHPSLTTVSLWLCVLIASMRELATPIVPNLVRLLSYLRKRPL